MNNNDSNRLHSAMSRHGNRPIAYYPILRSIVSSPNSVLMLSQLLYWGTKAKGWFYKTNHELSEETGLSEGEIKWNKKRILKLSFVGYKRVSMPKKSYYMIDWDELDREISRVSNENDKAECLESSTSVSDHSDGQSADGQSAAISTSVSSHTDGESAAIQTDADSPTTSEITTETTQENKTENTSCMKQHSFTEDEPQKKESTYSTSFNLLWSKYKTPHTKQKGIKKNANKAYLRAVELFDDARLLEVLDEYLESRMFELGPAHLSTFLNGLCESSKYRDEFIEGGFAKRLEKVKVREAIQKQSTETAQERYRKDIASQGPLNARELVDRTTKVDLEMHLELGTKLSLIRNGDRKDWLQYLGPNYVTIPIKAPMSKTDKIKVLFTIDELRKNLYVHLHGHEWNEHLEEQYQQSNEEVKDMKSISFEGIIEAEVLDEP